MTDPTNAGAPAGWYPDSTAPGQERYWDGSTWTEQFRPSAPAPRRRTGLIVGLVVAGVIVLGGAAALGIPLGWYGGHPGGGAAGGPSACPPGVVEQIQDSFLAGTGAPELEGATMSAEEGTLDDLQPSGLAAVFPASCVIRLHVVAEADGVGVTVDAVTAVATRPVDPAAVDAFLLANGYSDMSGLLDMSGQDVGDARAWLIAGEGGEANVVTLVPADAGGTASLESAIPGATYGLTLMAMSGGL